MRKLVWRNLTRNKRRTFLTVASVALALVILSVLLAMLDAMSGLADPRAADRLVVRNAISLTFPLPEAYGQRLRSLDHVEDVTMLDWYQGVYKDTRPENFFPRFGTDPETLLAVFPEYQIPDEQYAAFKAERDAFIAGRSLAEDQGWKIGDRIAIKGDIYPVDLDLVLRGIFTDEQQEASERQIFFHRRYVEEAMGNPGQVNNYWLRLDDPEAVPEVIAAAEAMFENSTAQVRAETAEAFALSFMSMMGDVQFLFGAIGLAIVVSILLITANTMAMAARERTTEVAVLRTLGFGKPKVLSMVIGESIFVGLLGAAVGVGLTALLLPGVNNALRATPLFIGNLSLQPSTLSWALGIGLAIGLVSGLFPAVAAARLTIVDGLRRI